MCLLNARDIAMLRSHDMLDVAMLRSQDMLDVGMLRSQDMLDVAICDPNTQFEERSPYMVACAARLFPDMETSAYCSF